MKTLLKKSRHLVSARPHAPLVFDQPLPERPPLVKRILVPIDFSRESIAALKFADQLAEQYGASIALLYVAERVVYFNETVAYPGANPLEEIKDKLSGLAINRVNELTPVNPHVRIGKPWMEIVQLARENASDLIVMGTHGRSGMAHLLLGSTAEQVVRHAHCPVLVVRKPQSESLPK